MALWGGASQLGYYGSLSRWFLPHIFVDPSAPKGWCGQYHSGNHYFPRSVLVPTVGSHWPGRPWHFFKPGLSVDFNTRHRVTWSLGRQTTVVTTPPLWLLNVRLAAIIVTSCSVHHCCLPECVVRPGIVGICMVVTEIIDIFIKMAAIVIIPWLNVC